MTPHDRADYAQIIKLYGKLPTGRESYSPPKIKGTIKADIQGHPNPKRICTSHVERKNGSFRQWCNAYNGSGDHRSRVGHRGTHQCLEQLNASY